MIWDAVAEHVLLNDYISVKYPKFAYLKKFVQI